uniref:Serine incorporator n=1 Tax=Chenopodium quinoa TaxID=63459 RepID=A0A803MUA1_CHEQI
MTGENTGIRVSEAVYLQELSRNQQKKTVDISVERSKSLRVRYYYGVIFLITNFVAWIIRDYIQRVIPEDHFLRTCGIGGHDCIQTIGVLRISFGCFIFFAVMFLTTVKTSKLQEVRNAWHSGWWPVKCILLVISMMSPFFVPSEFIHFYGEFARIGAGIFLALQLISVIQFIAWWNNYWMPDVKLKQRSTEVFYLQESWLLMLSFFVGLLSGGKMLMLVAIENNEPAGDKCSPQKQADGHHDWMTVFSFFIGICAIVMATFSTGIDSESFQFRKVEVQEEDDIPYKYGFFHLVFSLGAMYFAMLFISWDLNSSTKKWSIDVGWASTWVKIINEWFAATIYNMLFGRNLSYVASEVEPEFPGMQEAIGHS